MLIEDFNRILSNSQEGEKSYYQEYLDILNGSEYIKRESTNKINKTLVMYHEKCVDHGEIKENNAISRLNRRMFQVENPDRLNVLLQPPFGVLLSDFFLSRYEFVEASSPASLSDILKCHDYSYVESVKATCEDLKSKNRDGVYKYDTDTVINQHTWESSIHAVGCVIEAVNKLMEKDRKYGNALCLIRPPGHHAGYYGKVDSIHKNCHSSNGFCFFNNVAIGAAFSMDRYREEIKRIAIVDFDVHHGNGTQDIIKYLSKTEVTASSENKLGNVTITRSVCNPWLDFDDAKNVLFISTHVYDEENPGSFYPSSGCASENTQKDSPFFPGGILNVPIHGHNKLSYNYRHLFRSKIVPRLIKFKPDLIFISAGFDGHAHEDINNHSMELNEMDYRWVTEEVMKIANKYSKGRVISVLEGGYNINSGVVSSFAQSVLYHAKFLNIAANKINEQCVILPKIKRKREYLKDLEIYKTCRRTRDKEESISWDADNQNNKKTEEKTKSTDLDSNFNVFKNIQEKEVETIDIDMITNPIESEKHVNNQGIYVNDLYKEIDYNIFSNEKKEDYEEKEEIPIKAAEERLDEVKEREEVPNTLINNELEPEQPKQTNIELEEYFDFEMEDV